MLVRYLIYPALGAGNLHRLKGITDELLRVAAAILSVLIFIYLAFNWGFLQGALSMLNPIGRYVAIIGLGAPVLYAVLTWVIPNSDIDTGSLTRRLSTLKRPAVIFTVAICLSLLPALLSWITADPINHPAGGIIPTGDSALYVMGAEELYDTGKINSWNSRRPINVSLFSLRYLLTNYNFQYALLIQGAMFGIALFYACRAVAGSYGWPAGSAMFAVSFGYASRYLPTTLSESLGITLGLIAFALVWHGTEKKYQTTYLVGMMVLTMALMARSGAMLIIIALIVYAGFLFRGNGSFSIRAMVFSLFAVIVAVLINQTLLFLYSDGEGTVQGNFSQTLYGLASGGKGWKQFSVDYPGLEFETRADRVAFIYGQALEKIKANPVVLLRAYITGLATYPVNLIVDLGYILISAWYSLGLSLSKAQRTIVLGAIFFGSAVVLGAGFFRAIYRQRANRLVWLILISLIGIVLSLPIIYQDGGIRVQAATMPFIAAVFSLAIYGATKQKLISQESLHRDAEERNWFGPTIYGGLLILAIIGGPAIAGQLSHKPIVKSTRTCSQNEHEMLMRVGPGSAHVTVVSDEQIGRSFAPLIKESVFRKTPEGRRKGNMYEFEVPMTIIMGYDYLSKNRKYLLAPQNFVGNHIEYKSICASPTGPGSFDVWAVSTH